MRRFLFALLLVFPVRPLASQVHHIKPADFIKMVTDNPRAQILDLRDAQEYEFKHIPGAVNIQPTDRYFLEDVHNQLSASDTLFIYCRIGKTKEVSELLLKNGYKVIFNLKGGSVAWDEYLRRTAKNRHRD
ncbi:MAG TPA: rhodanese-like domain-containing protein [Bacteroidales bacterium]|nr:rhodanese-like domain-containing protein [Bacteroidales bacterium]HRW95515.1 rhodanese-like domain-containing protein [Bacteroidales bacterium]